MPSSKERARQRYHEHCRIIDEYKLERGCARCGYKKCAAALDAKSATISALIASNALHRVVNILQGSELLCKNCQAEDKN